MSEIRRANCHYCGYLCAFLAEIEDGRVVDIKPDPSRYPYSDRILAACPRWKMNLPSLDAPNRVNYPLRRKGERGSGEWERVSWDEALDDIAARLSELARVHGPQTLASAIGGPHTSFWPLHRFMNLFGSPNNMGIGQICWNPRIWMDVLTFGWTVEADISPGVTGCLVLWGTNPAQSDNSAFWRSIVDFAKSDATLIVVDARYTQAAAHADLWLAPKPGTDLVLTLGLIQVIIAEGLYDKAFVEDWCYGFDELADHVATYTPEYVAAVCDIPAADIVAAARAFAESPASALVSGRGIDQVGANVAQTHRAICCLRAITGNVDRPGSCILTDTSDFTSEFELERSDLIGEAQAAACLNEGVTPLQCYSGFDYVQSLNTRFGRLLPKRYLTSAHPDLVLRAMETGEPYPIRALIVEATNPLLTYADTARVHRAFLGLDLIVVLEYTMTSTARIADYVLPAAAAFERPTFQQHGGVANIVYGGDAAIEPYYERRVDYDVFRDLGMRLGQEEFWPDESFKDACARALEKAGMSWDDYCAQGIYYRPARPYKYLEPLPGESAPRGFATETGKIELASLALEKLGGQRLPEPVDAIPNPCEEAEREGGTRLALISGARKQPYNASMYLDFADFRKRRPYPIAEMSPATAEALGLSAGDTIELATDRGKARFRLETAKMRDGLVSADYGWWHPERKADDPDLGGIFESNINCLTDCSVERGESMIGTWSYNAIECVVRRVDGDIGFGPLPE